MTQHFTPPPYLHDRWEDEVKLEESMLESGKDRMKARIEKARKKHDMNRLRPYRSVLTEWVIPVAEGVSEWLRKAKTKRGVRPVALPRLEQLDPEVSAMVALKSMLRMLGIERRGILAIAVEIGTWCEHEARCKKWMEEEPEDWKTLTGHYEKRGSNAAHQRRSRISIFNRYIWEKIGWIEWTDQDRQRVGLELINIVIETTRRFFVIPDPSWTPKRMRGGAFMKRPYVLDADSEFLAALAGAMDDELVHSPVFLPTVIPPKDWEGPRDGGYHTPFVKTPFLIRFKAHQEDQRRNALEEYEALDMPGCYAAINYIQKTSWRINERVLEVAQRVWNNDLALGGIPRKEGEQVPKRLEGLEPGTEDYKKWAREAGAARTRNAKLVSRIIAYGRAFEAANRMKDQGEFYFPHMLDFRGRMYPIPSDLSPQGEDLHRGLLTFSRPKPVDREAAAWLAVHLANVHGIDKKPFSERIAWVQEREARWRSIAEDPLGNRVWCSEGDAWQCLAAIFEWVRWLDEGEGMMSSLPIRVDGTCNGIQHLSAMVRDQEGGASVNLLPSSGPRDIYQEVADALTQMLKDRVPDELAVAWLGVFDGRAPRSVTKRPVMILPYGGTRHAYFSYTMEWLQENDPEGEVIPAGEPRTKAVSYLVPLLWKAVGARVDRAREVMQWLKDCAAVAAHQGKPLWWRTPAGFYVRQFYGVLEGTRVETRIDGQRLMLQDWVETRELDVEEQLQAIAPNFVHSNGASSRTRTGTPVRQRILSAPRLPIPPRRPYDVQHER